MKKITQSIFIIGLIGVLFISCGNSNSGEFTIAGTWKVYVKHFECESNEALETQVNNLLMKNMEEGRYEYDMENTTYKDRYYLNESTNPSMGLEGTFAPDFVSNTLDVTVKLPGGSNWTFTSKIKDLNSQMMMLDQEMDNNDIEDFLLGYFNINRVISETTTAKMVTKAEKIKR